MVIRWPSARTVTDTVLPAAELRPNRTQRRALKRHAGLTVRELPLAFFEEHYELYTRYQNARHAGGEIGE